MVNETPEVMKLQKQSIDIDQQVLKTLMMERQNEICSPGKQWKWSTVMSEMYKCACNPHATNLTVELPASVIKYIDKKEDLNMNLDFWPQEAIIS